MQKNISCSTSTQKDSVKDDMVFLHSTCILEIINIFASFEFNFVFYHTQSFHSYAKGVLKGLKTLIYKDFMSFLGSLKIN